MIETTTPPKRVPMGSLRKTALVAGIFYLITFISIPTLGLYSGLKNDQGFITGSGSSSGVPWGILLEVIVALAGIGTAVTLYPVVKRQNQSMALGFVATRTLEAAMIFTGAVSLYSLLRLRDGFQAAGAADQTSLVTSGSTLVATYNGTFLLGQTLMPCLNAILLGTLLYRSGLVPRLIPLVGLIGAPLLLTSTLATLLGYNQQLSAWSAIATIPIAAWELSLGVYLVVKGFKPSPITASMTSSHTIPIQDGVTV